MLYPTLGVYKCPYRSFHENFKHKRNIYNWIFQEVMDNGDTDYPKPETPGPSGLLSGRSLDRTARAVTWRGGKRGGENFSTALFV